VKSGVTDATDLVKSHRRRLVREMRMGEVICTSLFPRVPVGGMTLPVIEIYVDGIARLTLIDSGCSRCIVYVPCYASWQKRHVSVVTVNGHKQRCEGVSHVWLQVHDSKPVEVDASVVNLPLGFECILGINGISSLGGVTILPSLAA